MQARPTDVTSAARHAAEDAIDVARWCMRDNDAAAAATALDAGRGLILYAALQTRDLEEQLKTRGEPRLAQRWRQQHEVSGPEIPTELRREVIAALTDVPLDEYGNLSGPPGDSTTRFLDPPAMDEIRLALHALGADALVYLVPGNEGAGAAVVVPVDDVPSWMTLPALREAPATLTLPVTGARDVSAPRAAAAELCDWAWDVATGPLFETHLNLPAGRRVSSLCRCES